MSDVNFRPYCHADFRTCLDIFDANCPRYFAPNEREDYAAFLSNAPDGYTVCELKGSAAGAFGLSDDNDDAWRINWILIRPDAQGHGIGSLIMERALQDARVSGARMLRIATSPRSEGFFARFGAQPVSILEDGWGPGLDRLDMELPL